MDILFLSHCVPNPPDKGEKIRAFHELTHLTAEHRVHLACLARNPAELHDAELLRDRCASVTVELLHPKQALAGAALRFAAGASLTTSFYRNGNLARRVAALARDTMLDATVVYSAAMAPYAPPRTPVLLDLVDVDSEKWLAYARTRRPGFLYGMEGRRLRRLENQFGLSAACSFLTTRNELSLFHSFSPNTRARYMENGVDFDYFDSSAEPVDASLSGRQFLVFVGAMNYYPNADAALWFTEHAFPAIRRQMPNLELLIVGRDPTAAVRSLVNVPGVHVTGSVSDVRPYLKASVAAIAPLRIARGVQNKVLEALAMGKPVLASPAVCQTLDPAPQGVVRCEFAADYVRAVETLPCASEDIRAGAQQRFQWDRNMQVLSNELCRLSQHNRVPQTAAQGWARAES
jgi:sugar transferase (PEP-CTERM/EpsH1 system associated)